jgi:hypothetical protein
MLLFSVLSNFCLPSKDVMISRYYPRNILPTFFCWGQDFGRPKEALNFSTRQADESSDFGGLLVSFGSLKNYGAKTLLATFVVAAIGCSGPSPYQPNFTSKPRGPQQGPGLPGVDGISTMTAAGDDLQGTAQYRGSGSLAVDDNLISGTLNNYRVANSQLMAEVRSSFYALTSQGAEIIDNPNSDKVKPGLQAMNRQTVYNIAPSSTWPANDTNYSQHAYLVFAKSFSSTGGTTFTADKPFPVFPVKQSSARDFGALAAQGRASFTVIFNGSITADYTVTRVKNSDLSGCSSNVFAAAASRLADKANTIGIKIAVSLRGNQDGYGVFPATSMVFVNDFRNGGDITTIASCSPSWNKDKKNLAYLSMMYSK